MDSEGYWMARKGRTIFPFRLNIQDKLPNSYDSKLGQVRYVTSAIARMKSNHQKEIVNHAREVFIYETWTTDDVILARKKSVKADTSKKLFMGGEGSLEMYAELTRTMVSSGGIVYVNVGIMGIKLLLWRHIAATNAHSTQSSYATVPINRDQDNIKNYSEIIYKGEDYAFDNDDPRMVVLPIYIPSGVYSLRNASYLHVQFFVQVSLMASMSKALAVELPIYITHASSWSDPPPRIPKSFAFPTHVHDPVKKNKTGVFSKRRTTLQTNGLGSDIKKPPGIIHSNSSAKDSFSMLSSQVNTPALFQENTKNGVCSRPNTRRSSLKDPDSPTSVLDFSQAGNLFVVNPDAASNRRASDAASLMSSPSNFMLHSAPSPLVLQPVSVVPTTTSFTLDTTIPAVIPSQQALRSSNDVDLPASCVDDEQDFDMSRSISPSQANLAKKEQEKSKTGKLGLRKTLAKLSIAIPNQGMNSASIKQASRVSPRGQVTTPSSENSIDMESPETITSEESRSPGGATILSRNSSGSSFKSFKHMLDNISRKSSAGSTRVMTVSPGPISPNINSLKMTKYSSGSSSPSMSSRTLDIPSASALDESTPGSQNTVQAILDLKLHQRTPMVKEKESEGYFDCGNDSQTPTSSSSGNRVATGQSSPITPNSFTKPWEMQRNFSSSSINSSLMDSFDGAQTAKGIRDEYYFGNTTPSRRYSTDSFETRIAPPQTGDLFIVDSGMYDISESENDMLGANNSALLPGQDNQPLRKFYDKMSQCVPPTEPIPDNTQLHNTDSIQGGLTQQHWKSEQYERTMSEECTTPFNQDRRLDTLSKHNQSLLTYNQSTPERANTTNGGLLLAPVQSFETQQTNSNQSSQNQGVLATSHPPQLQVRSPSNAFDYEQYTGLQLQPSHQSLNVYYQDLHRPCPTTPLIGTPHFPDMPPMESAKANSHPELCAVSQTASRQYTQKEMGYREYHEQPLSESLTSTSISRSDTEATHCQTYQSSLDTIISQPKALPSSSDSFGAIQAKLEQKNMDASINADGGTTPMEQSYNPSGSDSIEYSGAQIHHVDQYDHQYPISRKWQPVNTVAYQPTLDLVLEIPNRSYGSQGCPQAAEATQHSADVIEEESSHFVPKTQPLSYQHTYPSEKNIYDLGASSNPIRSVVTSQVPYQPCTHYIPKSQSPLDIQLDGLNARKPPVVSSSQDVVFQDSKPQININASYGPFIPEEPWNNQSTPPTAPIVSGTELLMTSVEISTPFFNQANPYSNDQYQDTQQMEVMSTENEYASLDGSSFLRPPQPIQDSPTMSRINGTFRPSPLAFKGNVITAEPSPTFPSETSIHISPDLSNGSDSFLSDQHMSPTMISLKPSPGSPAGMSTKLDSHDARAVVINMSANEKALCGVQGCKDSEQGVINVDNLLGALLSILKALNQLLDSSITTIMAKAFHGHIEDTLDALIILEGCRQGILPKIKRRLLAAERGEIMGSTMAKPEEPFFDARILSSSSSSSSALDLPQGSESEDAIRSNPASGGKEDLPNPSLIIPGSVFVFDEEESGICRWTDGRIWSPSRICGNFLVYRELFRKLTNEKCWTNNDKAKMRDGSGLKDKALKEKVERDNLVVLGCMKGTFVLKKDGLIKKTICVRGVNVLSPEELQERDARVGRGRGGKRRMYSRQPHFSMGGIQHLVCYEKPGAMENLHRPKEYVELLELPLSRTFIMKQKYRNPVLILPLAPGEQPSDSYDEYVSNKRVVESRPAGRNVDSEKKPRRKSMSRISGTNKRKIPTRTSSKKDIKLSRAMKFRQSVSRYGEEDESGNAETSDTASDGNFSDHSVEVSSDSESNGCGRLSLKIKVPTFTSTPTHSYHTRGQIRQQQRMPRSSSGHETIPNSDIHVSSNVTSLKKFSTSNDINMRDDTLQFPEPSSSGRSPAEDGGSFSAQSPNTYQEMLEPINESESHYLAVHGYKANGQWRLHPIPNQFLDRAADYSSSSVLENNPWQGQELQKNWQSIVMNNQNDSTMQAEQESDMRRQATGRLTNIHHECFTHDDAVDFTMSKQSSERFVMDERSDSENFQYSASHIEYRRRKNDTTDKHREEAKSDNEPHRAAFAAGTLTQSLPSSPALEDWSSGSLSSGRSLSSSLSLSPELMMEFPVHIQPTSEVVANLAFRPRKSQDHDNSSTLAENTSYHRIKIEQERDGEPESKVFYSNSEVPFSQSSPSELSPTEDTNTVNTSTTLYGSFLQQDGNFQSHSQPTNQLPLPILQGLPQLQHPSPIPPKEVGSPSTVLPFSRPATANFATQDLFVDKSRDPVQAPHSSIDFSSAPMRPSNRHDYVIDQTIDITGSHLNAFTTSTDNPSQFIYTQDPFFIQSSAYMTSTASIPSSYYIKETNEGSNSNLSSRFPPDFTGYQDSNHGLSISIQHTNSMPLEPRLEEVGFKMSESNDTINYAEQFNMSDHHNYAEYLRRISEGSVAGGQCTETLGGANRINEGASSENSGQSQPSKRRRTFEGFGNHEIYNDSVPHSNSYPLSMPVLLSDTWSNSTFETRGGSNILGTGIDAYSISFHDARFSPDSFAPICTQARTGSADAISDPRTYSRPTPKVHFKSPSSYLFPNTGETPRANELSPRSLPGKDMLEAAQLTPIKAEPSNSNVVTSIWGSHLDFSSFTPRHSTAFDISTPRGHLSSQPLYLEGANRASQEATSTKFHESTNDDFQNNGNLSGNQNEDQDVIENNHEFSYYSPSQMTDCQRVNVHGPITAQPEFMSPGSLSFIHQSSSRTINSYGEVDPDRSGDRSFSSASIGLGKDEYLFHTQHSNLSTLSQQPQYEEGHQVSCALSGDQLLAADLPSAMCHQLDTSQDVLTCLSELGSRSGMLYEPSSSDTQHFSDLSEHHVFEDERQQQGRVELEDDEEWENDETAKVELIGE
ncbi:hypothetical protein BGX27_001309 [Mortierella sp. AM989]|nr:hypothetical protein BGX27_001309 [Mortierella sp. AM989]